MNILYSETSDLAFSWITKATVLTIFVDFAEFVNVKKNTKHGTHFLFSGSKC